MNWSELSATDRAAATAELQLRLDAALATARNRAERRAAVAEVRADWKREHLAGSSDTIA